jgi:hypothetical protein
MKKMVLLYPAAAAKAPVEAARPGRSVLRSLCAAFSDPDGCRSASGRETGPGRYFGLLVTCDRPGRRN